MRDAKHFVKVADAHDYNIEVLAELKFDVPKMYKHHKQKSKDIFVDLYRFTHKV